ncbi:molybdopterin converting factor subunit 1 [Rhodovastum atsumiense]|uniref:Molybdopterin synthase sulfur carrier subunit n=1 Tax=Rhodovastum atsumiense TaxID=504468 RepID=A0A5M6IXP9_9PROT|nr:molybdopterin converting factor subunit 1 [Rhodovastum atsumiense]
MRLLYFAWLRERVGTSEEELPLPPDVATVTDLIAWLRGRSSGHEAAFAAARSIRCAVNQDFADPGTPVAAGDEVAFFPPVTGG